METTVKKQTAFRLNANLLDRLREEAKATNRSLSNYVEWVLTNSIYNEPNEATLEAIREARTKKYAGTLNTDSIESLIKSCEE